MINQVIRKIQSSTILTISTTLVLFFFILKASKFLSTITKPVIENYFDLNFYTENVIFKVFMLLLSLGIILIVNNGSLTDYGFKKPENVKYLKMILITMGLTYGAMIIGNIIIKEIINNIFPSENTKVFPKHESIIEMILTVWVWSSICEEVFVRGLLQSFMKNLKEKKIWKFSLPVIISGLLFGLMHLGLLGIGMAPGFVGMIVFFTTIIGFLAAYYREKTDSIIPPIMIHFFANLFGSLPLVLMMIFNIQVPT